MKIKPGFTLRDVCGENVIVAEGEANIDFSKVVVLNESAACVWSAVENRDFEVADMVAALQGEYDVSAEQATADCQKLAQKWIEAGFIVTA
ncbi:MAG: PqqD family protein [Muribaculaceae bacterium]|nr:PqqD family protein [Muribaculaceae bacterium]